MSSPRHP